MSNVPEVKSDHTGIEERKSLTNVPAEISEWILKGHLTRTHLCNKVYIL